MKVLICMLSLMLSSHVLANNKIKKCGSGESEVQAALDFIHGNANQILNDTTGVDRKEKDRFKNKMRKVNIKCLDDKPVCHNHSTRGGVSRHLFNSAVVICYNRIKDILGNNSFCGLVDVIAHEFAHTARVDKDRGHNNGPNNDEVYRLGDSAESLCNSRGLDHRIRNK